MFLELAAILCGQVAVKVFGKRGEYLFAVAVGHDD
jgi:hypothetical protein